MRLFSFFFFSLLALRVAGQNVRIVEQRFDFREFRFDITVETSRPDLKLTEVGLYNDIEYRPVEYSFYPTITIKSSADYLIEIFGDEFDTLIRPANPVLTFRRNDKTRFTIGLTTKPTDFIVNGLLSMRSKPVLFFSDGSQAVLSPEVFSPSDFFEYYQKRIPPDSLLLEWSRSPAEAVRAEAASFLCKSTLSGAVLKPVLSQMLEDVSNAVQMSAIRSIGRLRYSEYAPRIAGKFVQSRNWSNAKGCLAALNGLNYKPLAGLITGRFDTTRNTQILQVCCDWFAKEDFERIAYRHVVDKIRSKPTNKTMETLAPLIGQWKIREAGSFLLTALIELPSGSYAHSSYTDALIEIDDPEIASGAMTLLQQNNEWARQPDKWKIYNALLSVVVGYAYTPSIPLVKKLLRPDQPKADLEDNLNLLRWSLRHGLKKPDAFRYVNALKPSILQLISGPDMSLEVIQACLPLVGGWKIQEAGIPLLTFIVEAKPYDGLIRDVATTLAELNDTTLAVRSLALLQQNKRWLYQPEKEEICQALLSIVIRYTHTASLSLVNELLRPDQPGSWKENILGSLIAMYNTKTVSQVALNNYCKPLKKSVFLLTDHSNDDIRAKSLSLYCYMVQTGDVPTREAIVRKFLQSDRESDWLNAVHAISKFDLRNLAADACQFYQTTVDPALRWQLQKSFDRWEYPCR